MINQLANYRKKLDFIDNQIAILLEKRLGLSKKISQYKKNQQLPLTDLKRETEIIYRLQSLVKDDLLKEEIRTIYQSIFHYSKSCYLAQSGKPPFSNVGIIGFGLMGGSLAKALKNNWPAIKIVVFKRKNHNAQLVQKNKYIDKETSRLLELVNLTDCLIICTPISKVKSIAKKLASLPIKRKLFVVDIASIKTDIASLFSKLTNKNIEFVASHPLAGATNSGFASSSILLFKNRPWIITPHKRNDQLTINKFISLFSTLGAKVVIMSADKHDELVTAISHLAFLIATTYFEFVYHEYPEALKIAGPGFWSTTRLASDNPLMHWEIYHSNKKLILCMLNKFTHHLIHTDKFNYSFFKKIKIYRDKFIKVNKIYAEN